MAERVAFGAALRGGSAATPSLTLLSALMLTPIPMLKTAVPMIDFDSPPHSVYPGASLRDRATLPSPLRGLDPAGGYPSRLRSLRGPLARRFDSLTRRTHHLQPRSASVPSLSLPPSMRPGNM